MADIALVAGSFLGAWAWERVTPALEERDHRVHPLTLTGFGDRVHLASPDTTLSTHIADIVNALEYADLREVVLVAHSYAGVPATVAANRVPDRIARVVYVAAALPEPGRSLFGIAEPGFEEIVMHFVDTEGDGWRIPVMDQEIIDAHYGDHGLTPEHQAWFRARAVPQPVGTFQEPVPDDLSKVDGLPRTYVVCAGDPGEPPVVPGTPGWDVVTIGTGHWPMITAPAELARVLDGVATA
jgi:pimeloyl-ACP methyl ester carboxylesterase